MVPPQFKERAQESRRKYFRDTSPGKRLLTQKQSAVLLIVVTSTFLLLTMPLYISYLLFAFIDCEGDLDTRVVLVLIYHIAHKMYITNSAIHFVLYLFPGTRFRRDFVSLFLCKKPAYQNTSSRSSSKSQEVQG